MDALFIGPAGANIIDPSSWGNNLNEITLEVMRIILATGVFAIGVELPNSYLYRERKSLAALVVPTMLVGWFISSGKL